jgi:hypothetical protein
MTVAVVAILTILVGLSFWSAVRSRQQHGEWYRAVEDHIIMLAGRRPEGVSPSQWAYCVHWTWQLHSNFGGYEYFDHNERAGFLAEFDRRLGGAVELGTIDWIWDEYVEHTTGGRNYARNYRPTERSHLRAFSAGRLGEYDLGPWLAKLSRLPSRRLARPGAPPDPF